MVHPDITFAVQQCAWFCNKPSLEHEQAVKYICRYLLRTQESGLVFKPDKSRGLECFVDADWAGAWKHRSSNDPMSAHSRTGFVIMYMGCPFHAQSDCTQYYRGRIYCFIYCPVRGN